MQRPTPTDAPTDHDRLLAAVLRNPVNAAILARAPDLELPDWWLAGGAVFQTVWNVLDGRDPQAGINDYDLFYFDPADLSPKAENETRRQAAELFSNLAAVIEVCNEARVHLWFEQEFGVKAQPFTSSSDAIDQFASTTCAYAVTRDAQGSLHVYAPYGFADLFEQRLRPNPIIATREVYERKANRWKREWPRLQVDPWPAPQSGPLHS